MNELQLFNNPEFGEVRMIEIDGKPYAAATDIAKILGYSNPHDAILRHCKGVVKHEGVSLTTNQYGATTEQRDMLNFIPEGDLYRLIINSKLPAAEKFERWVFDEVLPSIRQHGAYMTPMKIEEVLLNPDTMIQLLQTLKAEREESKLLQAENDKQKQLIGELQPKAEYVDLILSSMGTMATTQIAADYGVSANKLNKILHEEHIQHFVGGQWILYNEHMGKGYTKSETIDITRSDGRPDTKLFIKWTQKGRLMINEILNKRGIYANMDIIKSA